VGGYGRAVGRHTREISPFRLVSPAGASISALVIIVFVAIFGVFAEFTGSIASLEAALGHGTPGYFLASDVTHSWRGFDTTDWHGQFIAASGRVTGKSVAFSGSYPAMRVGSKVPVLYPANPGHYVFPRHGNWGWLIFLITGPLVGILVIMVLAWAFAAKVIGYYWRRRRQRAASLTISCRRALRARRGRPRRRRYGTGAPGRRWARTRTCSSRNRCTAW
jgi:hypothetical protein